jgi:hypothetical protein
MAIKATTMAVAKDLHNGEMTNEGLDLEACYDITTYHGLPVVRSGLEQNGKLVIPHEKDPHPAIDYSIYSIKKTPIVYRSTVLIDSFNDWAKEVEREGGIEKHLWFTEKDYEDKFDSKHSLLFAKFYINRVAMPARIATLSAHDDLDEWDDWLYRCYAIGYDLEIIARTLDCHIVKFYELYSDHKKIGLAKQQRANDTIDSMEQVHRQILRGNYKSKESRQELSAKIRVIADTSAFALISARAYIPAYNPTHKVEVVPHIPDVLINTERVLHGN